MTVIDTTPDRQRALQNEISERLADVVADFCGKHDISLLSGATLALHVILSDICTLGGQPAKPYAQAVLDGMLNRDRRELEKLTVKMRRQMILMAANYDQLLSEHHGVVQ